MPSEIAALPNLGETSAEWLEAAGITTRDDLAALGAAGAYVAVKQAGFRPSLNFLWAVAGALLDISWTAVPAEVKKQLLQEVAKLEEKAAGEADDRQRRRLL